MPIKVTKIPQEGKKNTGEFNSNNKTSKKVVLDPQEKTLETQHSINHQKQK